MRYIVKRSVVVDGHKTSVSMEDAFWRALLDVAKIKQVSLSKLIGEIAEARGKGSNLSSAIRVFILDFYLSHLQAVPLARELTSSVLDKIRRQRKQDKSQAAA
jgi:predicted DNA-binding ribbon-helix-helix protein